MTEHKYRVMGTYEPSPTDKVHPPGPFSFILLLYSALEFSPLNVLSFVFFSFFFFLLQILAYSLDTRGDEFFTVYFKNLDTGAILPETLDQVYYGLVWGDDSTIYYRTLDAIHRPCVSLFFFLLFILFLRPFSFIDEMQRCLTRWILTQIQDLPARAGHHRHLFLDHHEEGGRAGV
jgi:hypothetical protein